MALQLLLSSYTQRLVDNLVESLAQPGPAQVARPILLPSRPLVERVRVALARKLGVAMGVEFLLPAAFLDRVAGALGLEPLHASWQPEGLFWRVLSLLEKRKDHERLKQACADESAMVALARAVADRFDQYLHFRPELIAAWDKGERYGALPDTAHQDEDWQRELWKELRSQLSGHPHPAERLDQLCELAASVGPGVLAPSVEVLATGPLPYSLLKLLATLGSTCDVRLRVLMPSTQYLGEIRSAKAQRREGQDADPGLEAHPLLAQFGRQSLQNFEMLMELCPSGQEIENIDEEHPEAEDAAAPLLTRLQADIRAAQQSDPAARPVAEGSLRSLRVHRCHGPGREIEVMRDELWRAFDELPGLRAEDVLILAPDLELYGPLAQALLASDKGGLPLRLAERRQDQADPLTQALLSLLELAAGRAPLSALQALLDEAAVQEALGEKACENLGQALHASGITFGLNAGHRQYLNAGNSNTGTWAAGLDRLLSGLWLGSEPEAADATGQAALPVAGDLGSGSQQLMQGLAWMQRLLDTLVSWQSPASADIWAERLEAALDGLLQNTEGYCDLESDQVREFLGSLRSAEKDHASSFVWQASSLLEQLRASSSDDARVVSSVGGSIALGGLKPLRALPCRVLAIVGLKDAAFPRRSQAPAWDLLAAAPKAGDRDPRLEDRQLFLDALLAASDRVILTAPARSPLNDKPEPLSTCVEELLRAAAATASKAEDGQAKWLKDLVQDHPLQAFDPKNFTLAAGSYNQEGLSLAQALKKERQDKPFASDLKAGRSEKLPDLDGLLRFLCDPAQGWLNALGVAGLYEAGDPTEDDNEAFEAGGLKGWLLKERALEAILKGEGRFLAERLAADRFVAYGKLGELTVAAPLAQLRELAQGLRERSGEELTHETLSADLGSVTLSGSLSLSADKKSYVDFTQRGSNDARTRLEARAQACLAAAAGQAKPLLLACLDEDEPAYLILPPLSKPEGRAGLLELFDLWQQGQQSLLPFAPKTSFAMAEAWSKEPDDGKCLSAGLAKWSGVNGMPGEADTPAAKLAWRGQDSLTDATFKKWKELALRVFAPMGPWWKIGEGGA